MPALDPLVQSYSQLAVQVGLNLRAGQRLLIIGPLANGGVSLEAAPLVRQIAAVAYQAGARLVETLWGDEDLQLARFTHAPRDSFDEFSAWLPGALTQHVEAGHAALSIYANDPDQLKGQDPHLISTLQEAASRAVRPFREHISRNDTNWTVIAAPSRGWAARVFPDLDCDAGVRRLWQTIARMCRLDQADPVAAWRAHLKALADRRDWLNRKQYTALRYRAPGTNLTIGLPAGHVWVSGQSEARNGILFAPNLPTEEVFTMPHRDRADGVVKSTRPLSYGGTLIEDFTFEFSGGRIVRASATKGESVLRRLVETDEGAGRLGEVALVPHASPISQSGLLFYNTLFDENAASHVAIGSAYKFTVRGGESMSDEEFDRAGGNRSAVHVDFMLGSAALDIDGVLGNGGVEPLIRGGEWATETSTF